MRTKRSAEQMTTLTAKILKLVREEPELTAGFIAERLDCSVTTISETMRAAGFPLQKRKGVRKPLKPSGISIIRKLKGAGR